MEPTETINQARIDLLERIANQAELVLDKQRTYFRTPREDYAKKAEALDASKSAERELRVLLKQRKQEQTTGQESFL